MSRAFYLTVDGAPTLIVRSFESFERAHVDASLRVITSLAADQNEPLDPDVLIGKKAIFEAASVASNRPEVRRFHGIVEAIEVSFGQVVVTLVPRLMVLADNVDHRVFLEKDSVTIAKSLLEEARLPLEIRVANPPKPRVQCVQAFESVLAFVCRILAEDGISIWIEHHDEEDVVVFGDSAAACPDLPGGSTLRFRDGSGLTGAEAITDLRLVHSLAHDGAAVADYDPEHPAVDLGVAVGGNRFPIFAFPGRHGSQADGKQRAQRLLEEAQSEALRLHARTTSRFVAVGTIVEVKEAPRDDQNGRFRVIEVKQKGRALGEAGASEDEYEAEFVAVPVDRAVRPKPARPLGLGGLQTMTVTGPSGAEIHTEDHGRIKARFRWDRLSAEDDTASAWVRPLQPAQSGGFFLPRVGWEVLVGFMNEPMPIGDTPIELGRLIHGNAPPAESLPGKKVRSNWGSLSTPGGGKENRLQFDDSSGNEAMNLVASKDYKERTENDKVVSVKAQDAHTVGGNHTTTITLQQVTTVSGAQTYSVGGNRDMTTVGVLGISAATESVSVGAMREFKVGGDYETKAASLSRIVGAAEDVVAIQETNRHVTGASSIAVGGTWAEIGGLSASIGVLGSSTLSVAGPLVVRASNVSINATVLNERYAGVYQGKAGAKLTLKAPMIKMKAGAAMKVKGADVYFKAQTKLTVKAGGVTITITPASIVVKGKLKGDATSVVTTQEKIG